MIEAQCFQNPNLTTEGKLMQTTYSPRLNISPFDKLSEPLERVLLEGVLLKINNPQKQCSLFPETHHLPLRNTRVAR